MYKLIRRISSSVFTRNDRPFNDDATSNAPSSSRKRRMSDTEMGDEAEGSGSVSKKSKLRDSTTAERESSPVVAIQEKETEELKEVRKGVKSVELGQDANEKVDQISLDAIANTPLPEDVEGDIEISDAEDASPVEEETKKESAETESTTKVVEWEDKEEDTEDLETPVATEKSTASSVEETTPVDEGVTARAASPIAETTPVGPSTTTKETSPEVATGSSIGPTLAQETKEVAP